MKPKLLLRIATACLLFFAFGHTIGHFTRYEVKDEKAKEVLQIMSDVRFDQFGQMRSFDENYTGMSLNLIFTLLAFSLILWTLASYAEKHPTISRNILIPISLCVLGFSITSFLYFFLVPAITCLVAYLLLVYAIVRINKIKARS